MTDFGKSTGSSKKNGFFYFLIWNGYINCYATLPLITKMTWMWSKSGTRKKRHLGDGKDLVEHKPSFILKILIKQLQLGKCAIMLLICSSSHIHMMNHIIVTW